MDKEAIKKAKRQMVAEGFKTPRKRIKQPTIESTTSQENPYLIKCPRACTQRRTESYYLAEKKTFDLRTNHCNNCGFTKSSKSQEHVPVFTKALDSRIDSDEVR